MIHDTRGRAPRGSSADWPGELLSLAVEDGTVKRLDEAIAGLSAEDLRLLVRGLLLRMATLASVGSLREGGP